MVDLGDLQVELFAEKREQADPGLQAAYSQQGVAGLIGEEEIVDPKGAEKDEVHAVYANLGSDPLGQATGHFSYQPGLHPWLPYGQGGDQPEQQHCQ